MMLHRQATIAPLPTSRTVSATPASGLPQIRLQGASSGRSRVACRVQQQLTSSGSKSVQNPFAEIKTYNDNWFDKLFIKIYSQKMASQLQGVYVPDEPVYDDFVRVSKEIMKGRNPIQQKDVVLNVLRSLLPPGSTDQFRKLFPPTQMSAELNAWFATLGFGWLVGEMELQSGDIKVAPGVVRNQRSIVKIKKCRYLEASGCVGMCVGMCKVPTQSFFTDEFGLPLTMKPNFEDLSCEMIFGQPPSASSADDAFKQPCFSPQCSLGTPDQKKPCPKLSPPAC